MTLDPRTATLDEIRDWFAERDGWTLEPVTQCFWEKVVEYGTLRVGPHPYPDTRDGAASAMPEGWYWVREGASFSHRQDGLMLKWKACQRGADNWRIVETPDTNNEIDDRYRLAALAAQAMDAKEAQ